MSKTVRIIPRLDIKGPNLVKGIQFEGLRVLGKPEQYARYYYEAGADELAYVDVVASLYNRNSLHEIISKTARAIFIPLMVGGGLRTIYDIRAVLRAGADKVSINTTAIKDPQIIKEAANIFGSSTIVVTIEAIKEKDGCYMAYTDNGRQFTGIEAIGWAKRVEELGAGEIMISSVDLEGTGKGYDIELTRAISEAVSIPVIAHGGAGKIDHIKQVIVDGKADAVSVASLLHYGFLTNHKPEFDPGVEGNTEFVNKEVKFSKFDSADICTIKAYLTDQGINCRSIEKYNV